MNKKIKNQIRSFIGVMLSLAIAFSLSPNTVNAADITIDDIEIQPISYSEIVAPMSTNAGGQWSGVRSQTGSRVGTVHLVDNTTYTVIVNFGGINGATGSVNLRIWGPLGYFDLFNRNIPVDGTSRAYQVTCHKTYDYFVDIGALSSGDFAYSIMIY